jgi:hypothetical protein
VCVLAVGAALAEPSHIAARSSRTAGDLFGFGNYRHRSVDFGSLRANDDVASTKKRPSALVPSNGLPHSLARGQQARTGSHPAGLRSGDLCPPDDRGERIVDRWVDEAEAALQGGYRHHSLTIEQKFFSKRTERDTEWRSRHREDRRSRKGRTQRRNEAAFVTGTGAVALTGPNGLGVVIA